MPRPELPPILLGELKRANIPIDVTCPLCRHTATLDPNDLPLPDSFNMSAVGHSMRCTKCTRRGGINVYPVPKAWVRHLRATGQKHRVPWFGTMMSE